MLKKLIAMQMENQAAGDSNEDNKEEINDMIVESQESSKDDGMDGRPRVVMKKFQDVLLKTYKNDNDNYNNRLNNGPMKTQNTFQ